MSEKKYYIRATPQNRGLGTLARGLRRTREGLDYIPLPEMLGGGLGTLLLGESPEEVEAWSYGSSPFKENPSASIIPIELRPGREQRLLDTAFLPVAEAYGLAKLTSAGVRRGVKSALSGSTQQGRREFLKKAGQAAAGAAAVASTPDIVRSVGKELAPTTAKTVVRAAKPKEFMDSISNIWNYAYGKAYDAVDNMSADEIIKYNRDNIKDGSSNSNYLMEGDIGGYTIGQDNVAQHLRDKIYREKYAELLKDPKFAPYADDFPMIDFESGSVELDDIMKEMEEVYKTAKKASGGMIENTTHDRKLI